MKTAKQIKTYVTELLHTIESNGLTVQFDYEVGVLTHILEELQMDSGKAQVEALNEDHFTFGTDNIPTFKRAVTRAVNKLNQPATASAAVTPLEREVLQNIVDSEYQDGGNPVDHAVWSFSVTNETRRMAGALGSLVKKGFAACQKDLGEMEACWITQAGFDLLNAQ